MADVTSLFIVGSLTKQTQIQTQTKHNLPTRALSFLTSHSSSPDLASSSTRPIFFMFPNSRPMPIASHSPISRLPRPTVPPRAPTSSSTRPMYLTSPAPVPHLPAAVPASSESAAPVGRPTCLEWPTCLSSPIAGPKSRPPSSKQARSVICQQLSRPTDGCDRPSQRPSRRLSRRLSWDRYGSGRAWNELKRQACY